MELQELAGQSIAYMFPGQGSQAVGMGQELRASSAASAAVFEEADRELGFSLSDLCANGPADILEDTWNAQPAILTTSIAALRALEARAGVDGVSLHPVAVAGHSLGEFTALVAAGVMGFSEAVLLVRERGRLMKEAGHDRPGGMAAVLGLDDEQLVDICSQAESLGVINLANRNCPGQTVISGEVAALERAMELARNAGSRRVVRLGVSIASHSPLMSDVSTRMAELLGEMSLSDPRFPVIGNVGAHPETTAAEVLAGLRHHLERPVDWTGSVRTMTGMGATTFVEVGAGNVLSGLAKRIDRSVTTITTDQLDLAS